jgi:hypothetical protein
MCTITTTLPWTNCIFSSLISGLVEMAFGPHKKNNMMYIVVLHYILKLNAQEKNVHAGEKLEDFEIHFRIKWC